MNTIKSLLASRFDGAAIAFGELRDKQWTRETFVQWHSAMDEAGRLVVAAVRDGYLRDIEGLYELVLWVESNAPHPLYPRLSDSSKRQAEYVRCHSNLMNDLIGNNLVTVKNENGNFEIVGDQQHGGLLQRSNPRAFPPRAIGADGWHPWAAGRAAEICRAFADAVRATTAESDHLNHVVVDDVLSERKQNILQALYERGAFDSDHRVSLRQLMTTLDPTGNENNYKGPMVELKKSGFVQSRGKRSGGSWLTGKGKQRAAEMVRTN